MDIQINPKGSVATDVALAPLVAARPQPVQEKSRPTQIADVVDPQATQAEGRPVVLSSQELDTAVQEVSNHLKQSGSTLEIDYDKTSGRNVFKVVDKTTGGVVFQIPSEEILSAARKLRQSANAQNTSGVLVDKEG